MWFVERPANLQNACKNLQRPAKCLQKPAKYLQKPAKCLQKPAKKTNLASQSEVNLCPHIHQRPDLYFSKQNIFDAKVTSSTFGAKLHGSVKLSQTIYFKFIVSNCPLFSKVSNQIPKTIA